MRTSLKQAIISPGFLLGMLGIVAVMILGSVKPIVQIIRMEGLLPSGFHAEFLLEAMSSNAMTLALPIAAALPFTAAFIDDVKSGYIKAYLPRMGMRKYIAGRITGCAVSGGLVLAAGVAAAYVLSAMFLTPLEAAPEAKAQSMDYFGIIMGRVLLFFCSGALWSLVGMFFAALTDSKYMAYASPFVIYYVLIILCERYFSKLYVIYPKEWIAPSERWVFGNASVVIFVAELIIIAALCFAAVAKRRLERL